VSSTGRCGIPASTFAAPSRVIGPACILRTPGTRGVVEVLQQAADGGPST
jgi:hypothetical protein